MEVQAPTGPGLFSFGLEVKTHMLQFWSVQNEFWKRGGKRTFNLLTNILRLNVPELIYSSKWLDQHHLVPSPKKTYGIQGLLASRLLYLSFCFLWTSFHFFSNGLTVNRTTGTPESWKWTVFTPTRTKTSLGVTLVQQHKPSRLA